VYLVRYAVRMASVKSAKRARRTRVTSSEVVAAAIDIVDRHGVDALTIRAVADACGLSPMGVYRHVRDKDDLLDQVVDAVVTPSLEIFDATGSWDHQIIELFRNARQLNLEHPGVAVLSVLRPTPVVGVARFYSRVLAALAQGGLTGTDAVHAFDTLLMFMFGSVLWEIPRPSTIRERLIAVAAHDEASALIAERANELAHRDPTDYFEAGLATILAGLRAQHRGRRNRRN
jgi:AcrR family transcriptional regulator